MPLKLQLNITSFIYNIICKCSYRFFFITLIIQLFVCYKTSAQNISNTGTEFWSVFPTHVDDQGRLANFSVFITSSRSSSGTITAGTFSTPFSVTGNTVTEISIPRSAAYVNDYESGQVLSNRAIHILVDSGQPKVAVYTHIFAGRRSAASLILPKEALGQQYYSMNYTQDMTGQNFIAIVATEANTKIHIKKNNIELVPGGIILSNINDVYEYLSDNDLTGVSISVDGSTSGCNRFAVFSGSSGVGIGTSLCTAQSIDPLFQQCYPITSWGKNYGFIPFSTTSPHFPNPVRTAGQYVRVIAKDDGTTVNINGNVVATLNNGQFYTSPQPLTTASYITANNPVSVAQYALSQACSNKISIDSSYSDPDMVILNPIEYNINHITVYSSTRERIAEQYINVLIKTAATTSFRINNTPPAVPFISMPTLPGYSYLQLNLNSYPAHTFNLDADDGFNAIAYGFGDVESYSYSAGTNLAASGGVSGILTSTNQTVDSTCVYNDYFFKLTLPYATTQLIWQMDAKETPTIQANPVANKVTLQGVDYYEYTFNKTAAYKTEGKHYVKILAQYPNSKLCSINQQQIDYVFTVQPVPEVHFLDSLTIMQGEQVGLNVKTRGGNSYKWTPSAGLNHDDIARPIASPDKDITYTLTVSNGTCVVTHMVHIGVVLPIIIPNTFTPNGDSINDVWDIKNLSRYYPKAKVAVYNRNGGVVFSSLGYNMPWDGRYNGKEVPVATYYYIIDLNFRRIRLTGWLGLIR